MAARVENARMHRCHAIARTFDVLQEAAAIEHQDTGHAGHAVEGRRVGQQRIEIGHFQPFSGRTDIGKRMQRHLPLPFPRYGGI